MSKDFRKPSPTAFISPATMVFLLLVVSILMFDAGAGIAFLAISVVMFFLALYPTLNVERVNIAKYKLTRLDASQSFSPVGRIHDLIKAAGVERNVTLFTSERDDLDSPFAFGTIRKGFLVIPRWILIDYELHAEEYDAILLHEMAHIKFGDSWKKELSQSLSLMYLGLLSLLFFLTFYELFWFNIDPVGWKMFNRFSETIQLPINLFASEYQRGVSVSTDWFGQYSSLQFSAVYFWEIALVGLAGFVVYTSLRILAQSRELYADAFAAQIKGANSIKHAFFTLGLRSITRRNSTKVKKTSWWGIRNFSFFGSRWMSFHPSAVVRKESLYDTKHILSYHMQTLLLGGVIAELANWQTLFQSKALASEYRSLGFVLPFVIGVWLLFVTSDLFVATSLGNGKRIVLSMLRNTIIYSFGVFVVHATLITAYALGFQMYKVLYGGLYTASSLVFWLSYVFQSVAIYIFVLPFILFLNGIINAAIKRHYLSISRDSKSYYLRTFLMNIVLMIVFWYGLFRPILALFGFGSPGFQLRAGSIVWGGMLFLVVAWANSLRKKRIEMECPNCRKMIALVANQAMCPDCGRAINQWAFIDHNVESELGSN